MSDEPNIDSDAPPIISSDEVALRNALQTNFLRNPFTVESVLREFGSNSLSRFDAVKRDECVDRDVQDCTTWGDVFLGKNPDPFPPMPMWNAPGHIDKFVSQQIGVEGTPEFVMTALFAKYLAEVYSLYNIACTPGILDEQWMPALDGIVQHYTWLLIGFLEPTEPKLVPLGVTEE